MLGMEPEAAIPGRTVESLLTQPDKVDLDSIAQHFVKLAGGPGAIAKLLYDEYRSADDGSPVRARIMEMILRAFTKLESKNSIPDDLSVMSDDDLERVLLRHIDRISGIGNGSLKTATTKKQAAAKAKEDLADLVASAGDAAADIADPPDRPSES